MHERCDSCYVRRLSGVIVCAQVDDHDVRSPLRGVPSWVGVIGHSALVDHWERDWTCGCFFTVVTYDTWHVSTTVSKMTLWHVPMLTFARPALNMILGTKGISCQCSVIDFNVLSALIEWTSYKCERSDLTREISLRWLTINTKITIATCDRVANELYSVDNRIGSLSRHGQ